MPTLLSEPAVALYALVATIVALHLCTLGFWTGAVRARHKTFVNIEDAAAFKGGAAESDHPAVLRVQRAHRNAIEAALPFFVIGFLYALSAPSKTGAQAYFFTFLAARMLHSVFYLAQKQPLRTLSFAIGAAATIGMAVRVIRVVV